MTHPLIQYRGYYRGPRDTGGMTAIYASKEKALQTAKAIAGNNSDIWANPVYVGPLDAALLAKEPLNYTDWRSRPERKRIEAGEEFRPGDIMIADHQITLDQIGLWLEQGKVESLPVAPLQAVELKDGEAKEMLERNIEGC